MEGYRAIVGEGERPYAVMAAVAIGIAGVLVQRAATLPITDLGAIIGTNDVECVALPRRAVRLSRRQLPLRLLRSAS